MLDVDRIPETLREFFLFCHNNAWGLFRPGNMKSEFQYPQKVAVITDNLAHATSMLAELSAVVSVELLAWKEFKERDLREIDIPVFDIGIEDAENVSRLKKFQERNPKRPQTVFAVNKRDHKTVSQCNALGSLHHVARPLDAQQLINTIVDLCAKLKIRQLADAGEPVSGAKKSFDACLSVSDLMDSFALSVRKGEALAVDDVHASSIQIIDAIESSNMETWLKAVREHSSYTYRHVMIVSGYAAAFTSRFRLPQSEKERLTFGALVHDIGKLKIPQKILDKPGRLTDEEYQKMQRHPIEGATILRRDGRIGEEVVAIARSHHEYLDGSGYPDGLVAEQIPDIVRVMTVIDIFSALVEARSYKESMSSEDAYKILLEMGPKLDQDIVRAFEPVALDKDADSLVRRINGGAA